MSTSLSRPLWPVYLGFVSLLCVAIYFIFISQPTTNFFSTEQSNGLSFLEGLQSPISRFLLQLILILCCSYVFKKILVYFKQPAVIGEVIAGIALGPSLFGVLFPQSFEFIFQKNSLGPLQMISQIGLILFMFTVGLNVSAEEWKKYGRRSVFISHASIAFPFLLGLLFAPYLFETQADKSIHYLSFALFIGIAMSITAFPVLARIIRDRKLGHLKSARMILACAAIDDVTAWVILAGIVGFTRSGDFALFLWTMISSLIGILFLMKWIGPVFKRWAERIEDKPTKFVAGISFLLACALFFEWTGVHALFGAFIAGVVISDFEDFKNLLQDKIDYLATFIFLPGFFAITGLRTEIGLLNSISNWLLTLLIIGIAILGKWGGTTLAARYAGSSWTEAGFFGILMNTRGLMELIVLNIGLEIGILSRSLYTMMVIMALVTTLMTGPCLSFIRMKKLS